MMIHHISSIGHCYVYCRPLFFTPHKLFFILCLKRVVWEIYKSPFLFLYYFDQPSFAIYCGSIKWDFFINRPVLSTTGLIVFGRTGQRGRAGLQKLPKVIFLLPYGQLFGTWSRLGSSVYPRPSENVLRLICYKNVDMIYESK